MKRWPALLILFALLTGAARFAWVSDRSLLDHWLDYEPPQSLVTASPPGAPAGVHPPALGAQAVVVIIGGLRTDASQALPALDELRRLGASRTLTVATPTERATAWATLLTGSAPYLHGVLADAALRPLPLDTVFDEAKAAGFTTAVAGPAALGRLTPRSVDLAMTEKGAGSALDELTLQHAVTAVQAKTGLTLVYLDEPAAVGAATGGTSGAYRIATAETDARLAQLLAVIDLTKTTVIVTSDHGLTDKGGSGGAEPDVSHIPLVAVGPGIRPGRYPNARLEDFAPTLAGLLGLVPPAQATGTALSDMLAYSNATQAQSALRLSASRQGLLLEALVAEVGGVLSPTADPVQDPTGYLAQVRSQTELARRHQWWLDVRHRLPWAGGIALGLLLYLLLLSRQAYGPAALKGTLLYLVLYYLLFLGPWSFGPYYRLHALRFSLSQLGPAPYLPFLKQRALEAALAAFLAVLSTGLAAGRKAAALRAEGRTLRPGGALTGIHWTASVVAVLGLQAVGFWAAFGGPFRWTLPPLPLAIKQGLDLWQITVLAAASPLWAAIAALGYRLGAGPVTNRQAEPGVSTEVAAGAAGAAGRSVRQGPRAR